MGPVECLKPSIRPSGVSWALHWAQWSVLGPPMRLIEAVTINPPVPRISQHLGDRQSTKRLTRVSPRQAPLSVQPRPLSRSQWTTDNLHLKTQYFSICVWLDINMRRRVIRGHPGTHRDTTRYSGGHRGTIAYELISRVSWGHVQSSIL